MRIGCVGAAIVLLGAGALGLLINLSNDHQDFAQTIGTLSPNPLPTGGATPPPVSKPSASSFATSCDVASVALPGFKLWRWGNLEVEVPESGLFVVGTSERNEYDPPSLRVSPERDMDHGIAIDAYTGAVRVITDDDEATENDAELEAVMRSIRICPRNSTAAAWPYNGEPTGLRPGRRTATPHTWNPTQLREFRP